MHFEHDYSVSSHDLSTDYIAVNLFIMASIIFYILYTRHHITLTVHAQEISLLTLEFTVALFSFGLDFYGRFK